MKHFLKLVIIFIITSAVLFYSFISNSNSQNKIQIKNQESLEKDANNSDENYDSFLQNIIKRVKKDYVEEKTNKQLFEAAAHGILSSLDPHSSYLDEDELKEMQVQTKGEFGGVGIEITLEYSLVKVISAIDDTPAQKARDIYIDRYLKKFMNEFSFWFDPRSFQDMFSNSVPATSLLVDFVKFLGATEKEIQGLITGNEKMLKHTYPLKRGIELFPLTKQVIDVSALFWTQDMREHWGMYKNNTNFSYY